MLPPYYYEERRRRKKKRFIFCMATLIVLFSALLLLLPKSNPAFTEVLHTNKPVTLQKSATLKLATLYACGHQRWRQFPLPDELKGSTENDVKRMHPSWNILRFEEQVIEAEEKIDTDCDNHYLLKLIKDKIIVTQKNSPDIIVSEERINLSMLTSEDQAILSSGIFVNSEYELLEILESFR